MPYFWSNFISDAMTTDAQSVNGMNPTFNSFFSGASEPAAHAALRTPGGTIASNDAPVVIFSNRLRCHDGVVDGVAAVQSTPVAGGGTKLAERSSSVIRNLTRKNKKPRPTRTSLPGHHCPSGRPTLAQPLKLR
jgi:hypothetical protein